MWIITTHIVPDAFPTKRQHRQPITGLKQFANFNYFATFVIVSRAITTSSFNSLGSYVPDRTDTRLVSYNQGLLWVFSVATIWKKKLASVYSNTNQLLSDNEQVVYSIKVEERELVATVDFQALEIRTLEVEKKIFKNFLTEESARYDTSRMRQKMMMSLSDIICIVSKWLVDF